MRRDAASAIDDLIHALVRHLDAVRQVTLCESHRFQELFEEDLARMCGCTMRWDADHKCASRVTSYFDAERFAVGRKVDDQSGLDLPRAARCRALQQ